MSNLYKTRYRSYLIDHHSPKFPCITFDNLNFDEYEKFYETANIDSLMVYCKDHWGMSYYPSKQPDATLHPALNGTDYVGKVREICRKKDIEFVAYFCFEYDCEAAYTHPEWRVVDPNGNPIIRNDTYAKWAVNCMQTGYRELCLRQLEEIVSGYHPDALFLDIFGSSLCYCDICKDSFMKQFGFALPETTEELHKHKQEIYNFLTQRSVDLLEEIKRRLKVIDPSLAITINFASHYPVEVRRLLDYQFAEPVVQDNWFSALYTRDTAKGRSPILMAGEFSSVYNYQSAERYIADFSAIAAQGCRVGLYSGAQHVDGTLEIREAELVGTALKEVEKIHTLVGGNIPVRYLGILQSDICESIEDGPVFLDSILRLKHSSPHVRAILGAMKLCEHCGIPYTIVPETETDDLSGYKVLLLPELYVISDMLRTRLERFVKEGGTVIAAGKTGLYSRDLQMQPRNTLEKLFGAKHIGIHNEYATNTWSAYVKPVSGPNQVLDGTTTPPVSDYFVEIAPTTAKLLATFVTPCIACDENHWINWWSPPPGETTALAAVTVNQAGNGNVFYCAFDLFTMAAEEKYEICHELFRSMLDRAPQPNVCVCLSAPDVVRNAFTQAPDGTITLHQLSQIPFRFSGQVIPVSGGKLLWRSENAPNAELVYPICQTLSVLPCEDGWEIPLPQIDIQQLIQIHP